MDEVAALIGFYEQLERKPRLEYCPIAAPDVEAILVSSGFSAEDRLPLMVYTGTPKRAVLNDISWLRPSTEAECRETIAVQNAAYGEGDPTAAQVDDFMGGVARGMGAIAAVDRVTNRIVGAGVCSQTRDGVTELAAVAVAEEYRKRGIATGLTAELALDAVSRGASLVFLMPSHEQGRRIYERAGFYTIEEQILLISRPESNQVTLS